MLNTKENPDKAGRIFPPIVAIEYGEVTKESVEKGEKMEFEFKVEYEMEMREARKDIEVQTNNLFCMKILFLKIWLIFLTISVLSRKSVLPNSSSIFNLDCHGSPKCFCCAMVSHGNLVMESSIWQIWN